MARLYRLSCERVHSIDALPDNTFGIIHGRVSSLARTLTAPLSGQRCVYYRVEVKHDIPIWGLFKYELDSVPFMLEDDTGRAIVDAAGAQLDLIWDVQGPTHAFDGPNDEQEAVVKRLRIQHHTFYGYKSLIFRESTIQVDDRLFVAGQGTREPDLERVAEAAMLSYREAGMPTRLRLSSTRRLPLLISVYGPSPDERIIPQDAPGGAPGCRNRFDELLRGQAGWGVVKIELPKS